MTPVFDFQDYRKYLQMRLGDGAHRTGLKSAAAKAMNCHTTYVSQVLNNRADLSLEQGDVLNLYFEHTDDEADFFLLLISKARAGTESLRQRFQEQIDNRLDQRLVIKNRVGVKAKVSSELEAKFYSSWIYGATHALVSIPSLQNRESLAEYLRISLSQTSEILEFLEQVGLVEHHGGRYRHSTAAVHLGSDSVNINKHHLNWRIRAMQSIERPNSKNLHYSAAYSLSKRDAAVIKNNLIEQLEIHLKRVKESKEEVGVGFCFDFFELGT